MHDAVSRFFDNIKGKRVSFVGYGVSHRDCLGMFHRAGAVVTLRDRRSRDALGEELCETLAQQGIALKLGDAYLENLAEEADILLRTPGMNYNLPELLAFRKAGGIVTSEMELFFELCPCPIFAVTGSDGKTTTTTLIAEMLKAAGNTVYLGGNIGAALLPLVEEIPASAYAAVELSSFQLISMRQSPHVAAVTNVAPNHLDVHADMAEYIEAKTNLVRHQNAFSRTVLNADNEITKGFEPLVRGETVWFSRQSQPENGTFVDADGYLCMAHKGSITRVVHQSDIRIPGLHNVENYLTAIAALWGYVGTDVMQAVAKSFGGVEHRIELVRELSGVRWYNDSIASSPSRTMAGLRAFSQKIILLAGGYDKKIPFEPLAPLLVEKVKDLILTGPTADAIEKTVRSSPNYAEGAPNIHRAENLAQAVALAKKLAHSGDIVSLSPACASFDAYPNFEIRGKHFKELVHALEE